VNEIIILDKIRLNQDKSQFDIKIIKSLIEKGLIETIGKTRNLKYILSKDYYSYTNQEGIYSSVIPLTEEQIHSFILNHLKKFHKAKMGDFVDLLSKFGMTREQTKKAVYKLVDKKILEKVGEDFETFYKISKNRISERNSL